MQPLDPMNLPMLTLTLNRPSSADRAMSRCSAESAIAPPGHCGGGLVDLKSMHIEHEIHVASRPRDHLLRERARRPERVIRPVDIAVPHDIGLQAVGLEHVVEVQVLVAGQLVVPRGGVVHIRQFDVQEVMHRVGVHPAVVDDLQDRIRLQDLAKKANHRVVLGFVQDIKQEALGFLAIDQDRQLNQRALACTTSLRPGTQNQIQ